MPWTCPYHLTPNGNKVTHHIVPDKTFKLNFFPTPNKSAEVKEVTSVSGSPNEVVSSPVESSIPSNAPVTVNGKSKEETDLEVTNV